MNNENQTTLWLGSFRYYLGRQTYAVSNFCDLLVLEWPSLNDNLKKLIENELEEAFVRDHNQRLHCTENDISMFSYALGMDCDRFEWNKVRALWRPL